MASKPVMHILTPWMPAGSGTCTRSKEGVYYHTRSCKKFQEVAMRMDLLPEDKLLLRPYYGTIRAASVPLYALTEVEVED